MYANLKVEKPCLDDKIDDLLKILYNFTNGKKNFHMMPNKQIEMFDKHGIGYKFLIQKYLKNKYFKASSSNDSKYVCDYCNQNGHTSFLGPIKKDTYFSVKQVWVPKVPKTNSQGPKIMWVPKVKA